MPGWIDFFEYGIICPHCSHKFLAIFIEDGNCNDPPLVTTSLADGPIQCPYCNLIIRDSDITYTSVTTNQID